MKRRTLTTILPFLTDFVTAFCKKSFRIFKRVINTHGKRYNQEKKPTGVVNENNRLSNNRNTRIRAYYKSNTYYFLSFYHTTTLITLVTLLVGCAGKSRLPN